MAWMIICISVPNKVLSEYLSSLSQCSHLDHLSSNTHMHWGFRKTKASSWRSWLGYPGKQHSLNALSILIKPTSRKRTNTVHASETVFGCEFVCLSGNCVWLCLIAVGSQLFWNWSHTWISSYRERATWDNSFAYTPWASRGFVP